MLAVASVCLTAAAQAETRTLNLFNAHTKERVSITFKKNGRYLPEGLRQANQFLRDWRRNEVTKIDPELLDLVWAVYQNVGASKPIHVVSSYRSPATNNMLRQRSRGVAKNSQHTRGKAMDFFIPGIDLYKLRVTGLRQQVGGVGYYPTSGSPFVHMDTGNVRHWPRMKRAELAKVFPDGKTLHIPSDGKPLSGYKVALAEANSGRSSAPAPTLVTSSRSSGSRSSGSKPNTLSTRNQNLTNPGEPIPVPGENAKPSGGGNLFASLFGGGNKREDQAGRAGAVSTALATAGAGAASPVIENPPVPGRKLLDTGPATPATSDEPIAIASAAPHLKPQARLQTAFAAAAATPPPNTLEAQRAALESGQPATTNRAIDSRFQAARTPAHKPNTGLSEAAKVAAANLGLTDAVPVPGAAPADNAVAAIAAATGTAIASPTPAPRPEATLAYASPGTAAQPLARALQPSTAPQTRKAGPERTQQAVRAAEGRPQASVSGSIPREQIVDPLAGFASLPDKSVPAMLSGAGTTRHREFAWLSHPNQRALKNVMIPGNRFVSSSFETVPYGGLRTDRFDGPAVVILPVRFAR